MVERKKMTSKPSSSKRKPDATSAARDTRMISMAERLVEQQLRDGTASAQVITHYLKLGSKREELEQQRLAGEVELQKAKIESLASHKRMEELYSKAIESMRSYGGQPIETEYDDEQD